MHIRWNKFIALAVVAAGGAISTFAEETNPVAALPKPEGLRYYTATLLADGKWLLAGGTKQERSNFGRGPDGKHLWGQDSITTNAILSDPRSGTWTNTGAMTLKRLAHAAVLLADGRVLVAGGRVLAAGGESQSGHGDTSSVEIYDPASGQWKATGALNTARRGHTATRLASGKVLAVGGLADTTNYTPHFFSFATAELYDPATEKWTMTGPMAVPRFDHTAVLLTNGLVLVAGGKNEDGNFLFSAELYDPKTGKWTATGSMTNDARYYYSAELRTNGQVLLIATGGNYDWELTNAWAAGKLLYDPPTGQWSAIGPPRPHFVSSTNLDRTLTISPESGSEFLASQDVPFMVDSADQFGVTNIQLFMNGVEIARTADSPFRYTLTNQPAGTYIFLAKAAFANGLSSTSTAVSLSFKASGPEVYMAPGPTEFISQSHISSSPVVLLASVVGVNPGALTNLVLNGVRQPLKTGNFSLEAPVHEGANTLLLTATDNQGRTASATNTVFLDSIPPTISITQPTNNAVLNVSRIGVRGTFTESSIKKIAVNGMPASIKSNTFEARNVFLELGTNTIRAVAEDLSGNLGTNEITIFGPISTNVYNIDPVQLIAEPAGGFAPLKVTFKVRANVLGAIKRVLYDFDGDNEVDKVATDLAPVTFTFVQPGEHFPVVTLETTAGVFSSLGPGFWFFCGTRVCVGALPVLVSQIKVADPVDIKCPDTNRLYVLSGATATLTEFDMQGKVLRELKNIGGQPTGFDVDEDGNVYVVLSASNQVWKYKPTAKSFSPDVAFGNGGFVGNKDGSSGSSSNELSAPFDVAVAGDFDENGIVVSDCGNHRVERFTTNGVIDTMGYRVKANSEFLSSYGWRGTNTEEFNSPKGICIGGSHRYTFICDSGNDRVTVAYGLHGPLATSGQQGAALGEFRVPVRACASKRGLCVVDSGNDRLQIFDPVEGGGERGPLSPFNPRFSLSSELGLKHPGAAAWLEDLLEEKLFIADTGNNRVLLIKFPAENPEAVWNSMKQRLLHGDIDGALAYFASTEAEKYRQAYEAMGTNELVKIFSEIPPLKTSSIERDEAEYYFEQPVQGVLITFPVHFVREKGKWKIMEY